MFEKKLFSEHLSAKLNTEIEIKNFLPLSGGDINQVFKLETNEGNFCIKINHTESYPAIFEKEALGLDLLRKSDFTIPKVFLTDKFENYSFLLLEFIESNKSKDDFWEKFGEQLARMHQISNTHFGLNHSNYIGSLKQENTPHTNWTYFYISQRIMPQIKIAVDSYKLPNSIIQKTDTLYNHIENHFHNEAPTLLHGDLWSGNYMVDSSGLPALIDPAVYYGNREMDIAMTLLFGGFNQKMYDAYQEVFPLQNDWKERMEIWQLYPLLVHVNLFGGSYIKRLESILEKF